MAAKQKKHRRRRSQLGRPCEQAHHNPDGDSAIEQHLFENEDYAANYNKKQYITLVAAHNSFYLCLFQAFFIKIRHPVLGRQKEMFSTLKIFQVTNIVNKNVSPF